MTTIATANSQKLGHNQIDDEHKILFDCIEQFVSALKAGKVRKVWIDLLGELLVHSRDHFIMEEALMSHHASPETLAHKDEHKRFIDQIEALEAGTREATVESVSSLLGWLKSHIQHDDKALVDALLASPMPAAA